MNNFAISSLFELDSINKRTEEFEKINLNSKLPTHVISKSIKEYNYEIAGDYFQNLKNQICEFVEFNSSSFTLTQAQSSKEKESFGFIHRDLRRMCCIAVPIYKIIYPIHFYNSKEDREPAQTVEYSNRYLNLVNVSNLHRIDYQKNHDNEIRVFFQLNFNETFEEIVSHKPELWKLAVHPGYQRIFL
jgi:hypothetical protein